ncbi:unnamed protein product [Prunus brigantina]
MVVLAIPGFVRIPLTSSNFAANPASSLAMVSIKKATDALIQVLAVYMFLVMCNTHNLMLMDPFSAIKLGLSPRDLINLRELTILKPLASLPNRQPFGSYCHWLSRTIGQSPNLMCPMHFSMGIFKNRCL